MLLYLLAWTCLAVHTVNKHLSSNEDKKPRPIIELGLALTSRGVQVPWKLHLSNTSTVHKQQYYKITFILAVS